MKFRKKPLVISAMKYTYPASPELRSWLGEVAGVEQKARHPFAKGEMVIQCLEDGSGLQVKHIATEGDWIIQGVQGEFYACKAVIFESTYENVEG